MQEELLRRWFVNASGRYVWPGVRIRYCNYVVPPTFMPENRVCVVTVEPREGGMPQGQVVVKEVEGYYSYDYSIE